jgi:hypothetical protein
LLPPQAAAGAQDRDFCLYVHIPFCSVRCGYCDFNTYTAKELGSGASQDEYAGTLNAASFPRGLAFCHRNRSVIELMALRYESSRQEAEVAKAAPAPRPPSLCLIP